MLDVLSVTDSSTRRVDRCPLGRGHDDELCALHEMLGDELARETETYETTTIADLVARDAARRRVVCPGATVVETEQAHAETEGQQNK